MTAVLQHLAGAPAVQASCLKCPCGVAVLRVVCVDGGFLLIDPEPIDHGPVLGIHVDGLALARLRSMRHDPTTSAPSWAVHRCRRLDGWVSRPARPVGSPLTPTQLRCLECHNPLPALLVDLGHLTHPTCARDDTHARASLSWSAQTYLAVDTAPHPPGGPVITDRRTNVPVPQQRPHPEGPGRGVPAPLARPGTFVYEPGSCEGAVSLVIGPGPTPEQVLVHHYGVDDAHPALLADRKPFADGQHVRVGAGDPS